MNFQISRQYSTTTSSPVSGESWQWTWPHFSAMNTEKNYSPIYICRCFLPQAWGREERGIKGVCPGHLKLTHNNRHEQHGVFLITNLYLSCISSASSRHHENVPYLAYICRWSQPWQGSFNDNITMTGMLARIKTWIGHKHNQNCRSRQNWNTNAATNTTQTRKDHASQRKQWHNKKEKKKKKVLFRW